MERTEITTIFETLSPILGERERRLTAAALSQAHGRGGVALVSEATGVARSTIGRGLAELPELSEQRSDRQRRPGGGRKKSWEENPQLWEDLRRQVEPETRGDPESPLLWVSKSVRNLAEALRQKGHQVSHETVRVMLKLMNFTLQANSKTREGAQHEDRDAQFQFINQQTQQFLKAEQPVISVDAKKKELIGDFFHPGREWQPEGKPEIVRTHDFPDPQLGKALPYGVYDLGADEGWVSVGIDHDTAAFAVATIGQWWERMGSERYPEARHLMITADSGGSNSARGRLWKAELQKLADRLDLNLWVCHFPPGTSKWNKIEHRLFSRITQNWRSRPLLSLEVVVNLIGATTTKTGLTVKAALDRGEYPIGTKVSDEEFEEIRLLHQAFHGNWNYVIIPRADWPDWNEAVIP